MNVRGRLADIQAQQVEVGRIRLGTSTPKVSKAGKPYNEPVKLDRFRLTSRSQTLIDEAAELFGGEPEPWQPPGGAPQWQVIIAANSLQVIVPPNAVSQFYEVWTGGKCALRCDGLRELLEDRPCVCGPDPGNRKCKPTTRLSLMLAAMRGVGIWRLESHGYYAAAELPAVADLLSAAGGNVPARLEMEERSAQVPDPRDRSKEITSRFMVPVLHVEATPAQLISTFGSVPAIESGNGAQPAAIEAPPGAGAGDDPDDDSKSAHWLLYGQLEDIIAKANDKDSMLYVREAIQKSGLPETFLANLRETWLARKEAIVAAAAPDATEPPAATAEPAAAPAAADKGPIWTEIQAWAGQQTPPLTLSGIKTKLAEWRPGLTVGQASAHDFVAFFAWLKGPR